MKDIQFIKCHRSLTTDCLSTLGEALEKRLWVQLLTSTEKKVDVPYDLLPPGPGIILSGGGSSGKSLQCLHPCSHFNQSSLNTYHWLRKLGIEPKNCLIFNSLPINHVSGLMPWWRSRNWGANHKWLSPSLMRNPYELEKSCLSLFKKYKHSTLTSLVPTQLQRLLNHPSGVRWLQSFAVVWVGGTNLPEEIANSARAKKIRLAPCYGTTETTAMVTALDPESFLQGDSSSGSPLGDVELRLGENNALEIRSTRIAKNTWENGELKSILDEDGWWRSGDLAEIAHQDNVKKLRIISRLDTAFHSGGETIFPEIIQERLIVEAHKAQIPVESIFLTSISDQEWGERLIALVRLHEKCSSAQSIKVFRDLKTLVKDWIPTVRPTAWYHCQNLDTNPQGKWEIEKWKSWMKTKKPIT